MNVDTVRHFSVLYALGFVLLIGAIFILLLLWGLTHARKQKRPVPPPTEPL